MSMGWELMAPRCRRQEQLGCLLNKLKMKEAHTHTPGVGAVRASRAKRLMKAAARYAGSMLLLKKRSARLKKRALYRT
jgi:hypothetical protein